MTQTDKEFGHLTELPDLTAFRVVGVGCGIGQHPYTVEMLEQLLTKFRNPLVLDADALNILAKHPPLLPLVPPDSILTPHPKEFERLFGTSDNDFERNELQRRKAQELGVFIILKGAHSAVATPNGDCYFNSTGNPGMATAGSGDVLTGILTGLICRGYSAHQACLLGVYLHGMAGDFAAEALGQENMVAGDIIRHLGKGFLSLQT